MANYSFPPTSRYYDLPIQTLGLPSGEQVPYLSRRFLPQASQFALLREHLVSQSERMDSIAARELGDPEAFWRICDANDAVRPDALTEVLGRRLRITLPLGIPGIPTR